jgi:hypothetical protein
VTPALNDARTSLVPRIGLAAEAEPLGLEGILVAASQLAVECERAGVPLRVGRSSLRLLASATDAQLRFLGHVFGLSVGQVRSLRDAVAVARGPR